MAGDSRLRAHIVFNYPPTRPNFLTLADLVTILREESSDYKLLSVCHHDGVLRLCQCDDA